VSVDQHSEESATIATSKKVMRKINPAWTHDELVLALRTLRLIGQAPLRKDDARILELSRLLDELPIHPDAARSDRFRDPDGVRRRLGHFRQLDMGQEIDGHMPYRRVWERYHDNVRALEAAASQIMARFAK
jgi:5-methylcytosine-specific restriction protein A